MSTEAADLMDKTSRRAIQDKTFLRSVLSSFYTTKQGDIGMPGSSVSPKMAALGIMTYDINGPALQTMNVGAAGVPVDVLHVRFLSNWGNPDLTCVYRIRVHGDEV